MLNKKFIKPRGLPKILFFLNNLIFSIAFSSEYLFAFQQSDRALAHGLQKIPFISAENLNQFVFKNNEAKQSSITKLCKKLKTIYTKYNWHDFSCDKVSWESQFFTHKGNPLIYKKFGDGNNVTLFLGGVHPDELTPMHLAFKMAHYLHQNPKSYDPKKSCIIVAPLVSPDGLFTKPHLRTNGTVDVNRNFLTKDWYKHAIQKWQNKRGSKARYFPGLFPNTEIETWFQTNLILKFKPPKNFKYTRSSWFYGL